MKVKLGEFCSEATASFVQRLIFFEFPARFLFWTDTGAEPKIERSGLDGSGRRVLIWAGILNPVSVAVDVHSNTLYFTDPARETVESCDLEGNARRILYYETNSVFYGIETFKVWNSYIILQYFFVHKQNGMTS